MPIAAWPVASSSSEGLINADRFLGRMGLTSGVSCVFADNSNRSANSCRTGPDRRSAGCGQTQPCWIDPGFQPQPQSEYWTLAGSFAKPGEGDKRCLHGVLS